VAFFETGSHLLTGPQYSYFKLPAGMTGVCHHAQLFSVEMGSHDFFFTQADLEL
jgi:hypothetical protein